MISSQRFILKVFNSIINQNARALNKNILYNFSSDDGKYQKYQFPYNFNRQQYQGYIKKVEKAKKQIAEVQRLQQGNVLPRRKRRVFDKPKHDTNTAGYAAWRLYDPEELSLKTFEHALPVVSKLKLQPKWVIHAFGRGLFPVNNPLGSHRQYVFEDNNLSKFILYEYRNTTHYRKNIPDFDYENQQHLRPQMRKVKRLSHEDFWQSQEPFQFRLNSTCYAQHLKFCKWLQEAIQTRKSQESYDSVIDRKFGRALCFNQKQDMQLFQPRSPFIMHVTPESFEIKKEQKSGAKGKKEKKTQTVPVDQAAKPKENYNFSYKLDEQFRKQQKTQQKKAQSTN